MLQKLVGSSGLGNSQNWGNLGGMQLYDNTNYAPATYTSANVVLNK